MTGKKKLGDAIVAAHEALEQAEAERARLIRYALDNGATSREIGDLLGVAGSTAWRWAGRNHRQRSDRDVLKEPAP